MKILNASEFFDKRGTKFQSIEIREDISTEPSSMNEGLHLKQDDTVGVVRDGVQVAMIRFIGVVHVRYLTRQANPPMVLSIAFDGDIRTLIGCDLKKL